MDHQLDALKSHSTVVADTGDISAIEHYAPYDVTTNPSLILRALETGRFDGLLDEALHVAASNTIPEEDRLNLCLDRLSVNFGRRILAIVPGRVSTEIDARLSFDGAQTVHRARGIVRLYEEEGISRDRILIKIAATWEGIRAAEVLEKEGIHCNLTLLFSFAQAVACARAGVTLISPFVGRILDWYRNNQGFTDEDPAKDPGVRFVQRVYTYYKNHGYPTQIMAASFRHTGQIKELSGCDLLTIAPVFLEELRGTPGDVPRRLSPIESGLPDDIEIISLDEKDYRWRFNEDPMAVEKLAEGIRLFTRDTRVVESIIKQKMSG